MCVVALSVIARALNKDPGRPDVARDPRGSRRRAIVLYPFLYT